MRLIGVRVSALSPGRADEVRREFLQGELPFDT
jgi:hypothetical protein